MNNPPNTFANALPRFVAEGEDYLRIWEIYIDISRRHADKWNLNAIVLEMYARGSFLTVSFHSREMAEQCEQVFREAWKRVGGTHFSALYTVRLNDKTRV